MWWREPCPLCAPGPVPAGPGTGPAETRRAPGRGRCTCCRLLRCADCGKSMSRKTARGIVYYTCSTYRRSPRPPAPSTPFRRTGSGQWPRRWGTARGVVSGFCLNRCGRFCPWGGR
ncbi:MAG: zinc ribbon domain-containing protein [Evtepia gabavorous]